MINAVQMNLLYVGGRPSTRLFRFRGSISNLFISSSALSLDTISRLHRQTIVGSNTIDPVSVTTSSVRYCYPYVGQYEQCHVQNSDTKNFK